MSIDGHVFSPYVVWKGEADRPYKLSCFSMCLCTPVMSLYTKYVCIYIAHVSWTCYFVSVYLENTT